MPTDSKSSQNSTKSDNEEKGKEDKKEFPEKSFFGSIKGFLSADDLGEIQKSPEDRNNKGSSDKFDVKDHSIKNSSGAEKVKTTKNVETPETPETPEQDNSLSILNSLKIHKFINWLKREKNRIIKVTASVIAIILIILGIVTSFGPTEQVASNVIFGERAMFSAFLVLVGFLILIAVFARKLLEITYFKNIHQEIEIAEGKSNKDSDDPSNQKNKRTDKKD